MGDFNFVMNPNVDRKGDNYQTFNSAKCNNMIKRTMIATKFTDTFRLVHGDDKKSYSWFGKNSNRSISASRIDYIWTSPNLDNHTIYANIVKSEGLTDSDHLINTLNLDTSRIIRNKRSTNSSYLGTSRKVYLYE